jgi:cytochrome c oxidase subunit IV
MASHTNDQNNQDSYDPITYIPHPELHGTKDIWVKFWILSGITVLDIFMYFAFPPSMIRNILFIVFGIIKAFYIVGTFMHLKHERLNLILTIILPVIFIIFFIVWMLYEGNFWGSFN